MASLTKLVALNGTNGSQPEGSVYVDNLGNVFGTASAGGTGGDGTLFEIKAGTNTVTVLANFNGTNGNMPNDLVADGLGNLYGTTTEGGPGNAGTVFEYSPYTHSLTTIANFAGTPAVQYPDSLVLDSSGDIFGTGENGAVFEIKAGTSAPTVLTGLPSATGITIDSANNLWVTTMSTDFIYEVKAGTTTAITIATANPPVTGNGPSTPVGIDGSGNILGVTDGHDDASPGANNISDAGTVYEIKAGSSTVTTLAVLGTNGTGTNPTGGAIIDSQDNVFAATYAGGSVNAGTIIEYNQSSASLSTVAAFTGTNGALPNGGLVTDNQGNIFGSTSAGGVSSNPNVPAYGAVFEVTNSGYVEGKATNVINIQGFGNTITGPSTANTPSGLAIAAPVNGLSTGNWSYAGTTNSVTINAYGYNNTIVAGGGYDTINAGTGGATVTVSNNDGNNTVNGNLPNNEGGSDITLGNGNNRVVLSGYENSVTLGNGNNGVQAGSPNSGGKEYITVGNGNNEIVTTGYFNAISVGTGENTIQSGDGFDTVLVAGGVAEITAAGTNDSFVLAGGTTKISGIAGLASISFGANFGFGTVDLIGIAGTLQQMGGVWELFQGGQDMANISPSSSLYQIVASADGNGGTLIAEMLKPVPPPPSAPMQIVETQGGQNVTLQPGTTSLVLYGYNNTVTSAGGGVTITGDQGGSTFTLGADNNTLVLTGYGDTVRIGVDASGNSTATGPNTISGGLGNSTIVIGNGNQTITLTGNGNNITTGVGNSVINAGASNNTVTVKGGNNQITVTGNSNTINTGSGMDTVTLGSGWYDTVNGGSGTTSVTGGYETIFVAGTGVMDVANFSTQFGDVLNLKGLEAADHVTASAFTGTLLAGGTLDIYVTPTGGSPMLIAALTGANATLGSLEASHSVLV